MRVSLLDEPELPIEPAALLPDRFRKWFASRGWLPREHQLALLQKAREDRSALLIAPTGAGKTLAGFLPTLVELSDASPLPVRGGLHTLYISPLKALAVDIARNLQRPVAEMGLSIRIETRTGDTPVSRRQRQRRYPPDILLTTPEQLALLLASVGIYGVMSYSVAQRTREIGIRIALGARRIDVLQMTMMQGLKLVGAGMVFGLLAALFLTQVMASLLFGISATDPITFIGISLVLFAVAILASYVPALRATRVDQITALRAQ